MLEEDGHEEHINAKLMFSIIIFQRNHHKDIIDIQILPMIFQARFVQGNTRKEKLPLKF